MTFDQIGKYGRLGNQLFQLASTIGIAETHKHCWFFPEHISETCVGKLFGLQGTKGKEQNDQNFTIIKEQDETLYTISLPPPSHPQTTISLIGYFQNWQYFEESIPTLKRTMQISPELIRETKFRFPEVMAPNSVAVHVRRGDFTKAKNANLYIPLDVQYYKTALTMIPDIDVVIIVSDDMEWCKQHISHFTDKKIIYSTHEDELSDFVLLYLAKHIVTANSTFSWWAAFLKVINDGWGHDGLVVAPDTWFCVDGRFAHLNRKSFLPPHWKLGKVKARISRCRTPGACDALELDRTTVEDEVSSSDDAIAWNEYRLADAIAKFSDAPGCEKYPDSIVCAYEKETAAPNDITILARILERRAKPSLALDERTVLVHLRLGDGLCARVDERCRGSRNSVPDCWNHDADCWSDPNSITKQYAYSRDWYVSVLQRLSELQIVERILLIGDKRHWTRTLDPRGGNYTVDDSYIENAASFFREAFPCVRILVSGNPDEDFALLSSAKYFVQGGGGFSALIAQIVKARGGTVIKPFRV